MSNPSDVGGPQGTMNGAAGTSATEGSKEFRPYVPAEESPAELSVRAVILGSLFGIIFGAATVYLALKAGLTVSASIPVAVLSIAVFKKLGKSTILENNMVQTIASAGESVAAGVVFTTPALLFLSGGDAYFKYLPITLLAAVGGILGVLFMVPLRKSLIVKEHENLPYPEGTACADVLIVGEKGGDLAKRVYFGIATALLYKLGNNVLGLWKEVPALKTGPLSVYPNATLDSEITPEYLGLGYIIGPRIASEMFSGGVFSWLVLIPLISLFVPDSRRIDDLHALGFSDAWIGAHAEAEQIYRAYIRYIGAGAVACAGLMTLLRSLPTIISSFRDSVRELRAGTSAATKKRTERELPLPLVLIGSAALVLILAVLPSFPGTFPGSLLMSLLVIVFGFFFVTVSSRIVGVIGSSSNPISGMTIATLMATCLIFVALGWTGQAEQAAALMVGSVVCIAAANAGATSQDLKTGFLVGATPVRQQIGLVIGVLVSVLVVGGTLLLLDRSVPGELHGIGSARMPAPQGTLMATIIKGLLSQKLPWGPVLVGVFAAFVAQLAGAHALSWAVGAYLPVATTAPIWVGGIMKWFVDRQRNKGSQSNNASTESDVAPGMLYATGLVAGGSLAGIAIAMLIGFGGRFAAALNLGSRYASVGLGFLLKGASGDLFAFFAFSVMCAVLLRQALPRAPSPPTSADPPLR